MGKRPILPGGLRFNTPYKSTRKDKKKMVFVVNPKTGRVKTIHFGQRNSVRHSENVRKNYLKRSAGIRNKKGQLTKNNKLSANYWSRRILWMAR